MIQMARKTDACTDRRGARAAFDIGRGLHDKQNACIGLDRDLHAAQPLPGSHPLSWAHHDRFACISRPPSYADSLPLKTRPVAPARRPPRGGRRPANRLNLSLEGRYGIPRMAAGLAPLAALPFIGLIHAHYGRRPAAVRQDTAPHSAPEWTVWARTRGGDPL